MTDKHRFIPNILKLSHSQDIEVAVKEWYSYPLNEIAVPKLSLQCACNAWMTYSFTYINSVTGHAILLGRKCKKNLEQSKKNGTRSNEDAFNHNERVTYTNITDMDSYSAQILRKIIEDIRRKVPTTFNLEILMTFKQMLLSFPIDTSDVVQLINDKIQNCHEAIERDRQTRVQEAQRREQFLQQQREFVEEQRRIRREAAQREEAIKREEERIKLERDNQRARDRIAQKQRDAEAKAERDKQNEIIAKQRRIEQLEREKKEKAEQEAQEKLRIIKNREIAAKKKIEIDEKYEFCKCHEPIFKQMPGDDPICKKCNKYQTA
jgi:hypothetical protein